MLAPGSSNFYYVGGTSMATPHVASVAALMLQNGTLTQAQIESILKTTALSIPASGSQVVLDNTVVATITWDTDGGGGPALCDAVGAGLVRANTAVAAVP